MKKASLSPTLWRTCRAINNHRRLELWKMVFEFDGEFYVRQFARRAGLSDSRASISLRMLNSRGLIGVRRDNVKVYYNLEHDRSLPDSVKIQYAFAKFFKGELSEGWEKEILKIMKGFAHFNRLAILIRLSQGPAEADDLAVAMGVCVKSFYHHCRLLKSAGLVTERKSCHSASTFHLLCPVHPIAKALLDVLFAGAKKGIVYYNPGSGRETPAGHKNIKHADIAEILREKQPFTFSSTYAQNLRRKFT